MNKPAVLVKQEVKKLGTPIKMTCFFMLTVPSAFAYVDPGSGMLLWQGVVALIGAVLIFLRNPIRIIKYWIDRIRGK